MVRQVEHDRVESVQVNAGGVPARVEVARLVLGGDEASVQPETAATGCPEKLDRFAQPVEEPSTAWVPAEPLDDLVPRRNVLAFCETSRVRVERRKHTTTLWLGRQARGLSRGRGPRCLGDGLGRSATTRLSSTAGPHTPALAATTEPMPSAASASSLLSAHDPTLKHPLEPLKSDLERQPKLQEHQES